MRFQVFAYVHPKQRRSMASDLQVRTILEREPPRYLPQKGDDFSLECTTEFVSRTYQFVADAVSHQWTDTGEEYTLHLAGSFDTLKHLAVVHEWDVLTGLSELSKDQQELIQCRTGMCDHNHSR